MKSAEKNLEMAKHKAENKVIIEKKIEKNPILEKKADSKGLSSSDI
jgi:hypothetical protein